MIQHKIKAVSCQNAWYDTDFAELQHDTKRERVCNVLYRVVGYSNICHILTGVYKITEVNEFSNMREMEARMRKQ